MAADAPGGRGEETAQALRVLVIAYKFPDVILPGGSTRIEKLLKYLPPPWSPVVLSVQVPDESLVEDVHRGPQVHRTGSHYGAFVRAYRSVNLGRAGVLRRWGIHTVRVLKNLLLVPDDAVLWWPRAYPEALRLAHRYQAQAVLVSGPPFSGLVLGASVGRAARLPFVADLRDDWAGNALAGRRNPVQALTEFPLERWTLRRAARIIHVTEASLDLYRRRYPEIAERMALVRNGYDEEDFAGTSVQPKVPGSLWLLHAGTLKDGRDPSPVFEAMALLARQEPKYRTLRLTQVGATHQEILDRAERLDLAHQTEWIERVPRARVAALLGKADALLLLPTPEAPTAIPGKAYEYLRAGRPLLVVSDENETTQFLRGFSGVAVRSPEDVAGIAGVLSEWFEAAEIPTGDPAAALPYSRRAQAGELAALLDEVRREKIRAETL
ncbi:MAG: glycosyltransferase [Deferrisomatales bacterium]|nr:glycosyltransferase [Deferrisomatales bacterium]